MSDKNTFQIERFISNISENSYLDPDYLCLDPPGEHTYIFKKSKNSISFLAGVITGEGIKRTLGSYALILSSIYPPAASLLPMISKTELISSDDLSPDVVIMSNRIRLVDLDADLVYTIDNGHSSGVTDEIEVRQKLPKEVNTPQMYEYDYEFPYFSEELIRGYRPRSPIDDWNIISDALDQLSYIHTQNTQRVETEVLISNIEHNLQKQGLDHEPFNSAMHAVNKLEKPEYIYKGDIHGDVHARNIICTSENVYILDWESYKNDFVFRDIFKPFSISYFDTRNGDFYAEMVGNRGKGGRVYEEYMDENGSVICSEPRPYSSLPLLYLLLELSRKTQSDLWRSYKQQLTEVLSQTNLE